MEKFIEIYFELPIVDNSNVTKFKLSIMEKFIEIYLELPIVDKSNVTKFKLTIVKIAFETKYV
jgi:hypothetical protein